MEFEKYAIMSGFRRSGHIYATKWANTAVDCIESFCSWLKIPFHVYFVSITGYFLFSWWCLYKSVL